MTSINSYRDLIVWKKSMDLAVMIYGITRQLPAEEKFGITSQMRRAASSVAANIAEGQARRTTGEFLQSLGMARGSLAELETFIELCARLEYIEASNSATLSNACAEINKMLTALMHSLSMRR